MRNDLWQSVVKFDAFAQSFRFRLPEGKEKFQSCKGCCLTLLLLTVLVFYGVMQSIKLVTFDETDVMVSQRDAYFDTNEVYSDNLMYAFGITAYDSNREPIEDPSIGQLKPYYKNWGIKESNGVDFEELPTRNCTEAEFHINGKSKSDSFFFKPHSNNAGDLSFYYKHLKCLDVDAV